MYQVYTHSKYRGHGKKFFEGVNKRYAEYADEVAENHTLKHVEATAATTESEGNIEYWHCEDCGKYFSDKDGKTAITLADTVIAKLDNPPTSDNSHMALWFALLFVSGDALVGTAVHDKKKKRFVK